ncbi:MAG: DIP1984 family protein [Lachnospiraceae bacterium]|nr:DIP1984 family protein [Lachnospiraceae bacterium]
MKLAEALQERADLNRQIEQLKSRLSSNAIVQEGEEPAENPQELIKELNGSISRLEELIGRINLTNCATKVDGSTLTELIAKKDCINLKLIAYQNLVYDASQTARRATRTEIKILSTVDVKSLQKTVDKLSKELRLIENKIQETNWTTELK